MSKQKFMQGNGVKSRVVFRDLDGDLIDPVTVFHRLREPDGTKTDYRYLVDDEVVRASEGAYEFRVNTAAQHDDYTSRWIGYDADGNEIANEVTFTVQESAFETADPTP
jgi:hypothetical protein